VTNAAYNLFFRRRKFYEENKNGVDYDRIAHKVDPVLEKKGSEKMD